MNKTKAIEVLVDSICARTYYFTKALDKIITNPQFKVISAHEFLLFLIHHVDRIAYLKGFQSNNRLTMREEILLDLLDRDILPPRIEERLIEDGVKPSRSAFGTSPSIAIKALLPMFHKAASESDEYYSGCNTLIGKYPSDGRGLINRLLAKISEHYGQDMISEMLITDIAIKSVLDKSLAKKDNQALDVLNRRVQSDS